MRGRDEQEKHNFAKISHFTNIMGHTAYFKNVFDISYNLINFLFQGGGLRVGRHPIAFYWPVATGYQRHVA